MAFGRTDKEKVSKGWDQAKDFLKNAREGEPVPLTHAFDPDYLQTGRGRDDGYPNPSDETGNGDGDDYGRGGTGQGDGR